MYVCVFSIVFVWMCAHLRVFVCLYSCVCVCSRECARARYEYASDKSHIGTTRHIAFRFMHPVEVLTKLVG